MNYSLNMPLIKILVAKDWYLHRSIVAMYLVGSLIALSFIGSSEWGFYMGSTLLISAVIGLGNHQINTSVINERKDSTLPFMMSLPVTPKDYLIAKFLANMSLYLIPWSIICAATFIVFWVTPIPDGMLPITIILCVYLLLCYCVSWVVGMMVESEGVVVFTMVFTNVLFGPVVYSVSRFTGIAKNVGGAVPVWTAEFFGIILVELLVVLAALAFAFYMQGRKTTFL